MASASRPRLCLNMIVRNESHIVHEVLDAVAPYINYWVIVDTGSDDGTQDYIRNHMAGLGIPGELHERPWKNFGHNRTEALELARGKAEYAWVIDADDMVVGTPDFSRLRNDSYQLKYGSGFSYWRRQIFRDGLPWRYEGVVHEYPVCDATHTEGRLEGEYYIDSRRLGARSHDPKKYERDRDLLLAEIERNPDDARSVFYCAQSCFDARDPDGALKWYRRRAEMGGWEEEVYYSLFRVAECLAWKNEPWAIVQEAYLAAWEYRPQRAEPLHAIAAYYRANDRFALGYLFARDAANIPLPTADVLFTSAQVYTWRARDEQAICAYWLGKHPESFALCRLLLASDDVPEDQRERIRQNRDFAVPSMLALSDQYPEALVRRRSERSSVAADAATVTATIIAAGNRTAFARTMNSFVNTCVDLDAIDRFVCIDFGLSVNDRRWVSSQYPFLEIVRPEASIATDAARAEFVRTQITSPYWLYLGDDWHFFAPERYVARTREILDAVSDVGYVGVNINFAEQLANFSMVGVTPHRAPSGQRYLVAPMPTDPVPPGALPACPTMVRMSAVRGAGQPRRAATLDEIVCVRPQGTATPTTLQAGVLPRLSSLRSTTR